MIRVPYYGLWGRRRHCLQVEPEAADPMDTVQRIPVDRKPGPIWINIRSTGQIISYPIADPRTTVSFAGSTWSHAAGFSVMVNRRARGQVNLTEQIHWL